MRFRINDKNGIAIPFSSSMAAINYMAKRGWVLDQTAYGVKGCEELQYIMKKMVKSDDEIMYGLNIYGSPLKPSTNN
ncbi:MAG: hypothetical protein WCS15_09220, partial [Prevotella sp.]